MKNLKKILFISLLLIGLFVGYAVLQNKESVIDYPIISESQSYSSKNEVADYIHLFDHLPDNYITKSEAKKLGWIAEEGNLWDVTDHKSIGGDKFQNYEMKLPKADKRQYYECDIDYEGGQRNAKRIVFSNDGLIYYTEDHYNTFELLYGE